MKNELLIPPAAEEDPKSIEVAEDLDSKWRPTCEPEPARVERPSSLGHRACGFSRTRCQRV
jgi:hypothetical protein